MIKETLSNGNKFKGIRFHYKCKGAGRPLRLTFTGRICCKACNSFIELDQIVYKRRDDINMRVRR